MERLTEMLPCLFLLLVSLAYPFNLIENGGLDWDRDGDGVADGWTPQIHTHEGGEGYFLLDETEKIEGNASQKIVHTSEKGWVRISQEPIPASPNSYYIFHCYAKGSANFSLIVYEFTRKGDYKTHHIGGGKSKDWQRFSALIKTGEDARHFKVSLIAESKGEAWFDDIVLLSLSARQVLAPYTYHPPKIDGSLDDECWREAGIASPFFLLGGEGKPASPQTEALLLYDAQNLYIGFRCQEPRMGAIKVTYQRDGEPVYRDDCVEVYFDPYNTKSEFYQIVVNPRGARFNLARLGRGRHRNWWEVRSEGKWNPEWEAKAKMANDEWTVEIRMPFSAFGQGIHPLGIWGINFCRSRKVEGTENSSWAYIELDSFHDPSSFGQLTFQSNPSQHILSPQRLEPSLPVIVPQPREVNWRGNFLHITEGSIVLNDDIGKEEFSLIGNILERDLRERFSLPLPLMSGREWRGGKAIIVGEWNKNSALRKVLKQNPAPPKEEGYAIVVKGESICVVGRDVRGTFYGLQTLRQILLPHPQGGILVPYGEIKDFPALKFRGWHWRGPKRGEVDLYKRLIDVLSFLKYNAIIWEVNAFFPYQKHPDIASSQAPTREELEELIAYARARHFEVIPQVQTFGHFEYVLNNPKYKHLSENPVPDPRWGNYNYCPSNEEVYQLVFDMFDEVIDVFKPRYFHIGHDEIVFTPIGVCPRCQGTAPYELLRREIQRLYDYLTSKGLKVMMWCDQLEEDRTGGVWNGVPYNTYLAGNLLPKDIIICCWHYDVREDFPWPRRHKDKGFPVIACGWYHAQNVYDFSSTAYKEGIMGYCGTTWAEPGYMEGYPDLMSAIVIGGENSWSPLKPRLEDFPYHPTDKFREIRDLVRGENPPRVKEFIALEMVGNKDVSEEDFYDEESLSPGVKWSEGIPFLIPERCYHLSGKEGDESPTGISLKIGENLKGLCFLHTTSERPYKTEDMYERFGKDPKKIGSYKVLYEDGSSEEIDLLFRRNITEWNDRLGNGEAPIVLKGKAKDGSLVHICALKWENPHPEKKITALQFQSSLAGVQPILLAITGWR